MVKFAHLADCHLGAFSRRPLLREYNMKAFEKAIETCMERKVDFIIIAGDLFHNPMPDMDIVNKAVKVLMKVKNRGISIYSVYGSHDYNLARASLIDVLESAELFKNVVTFLESDNRLTTIRDPSGVSLTGLGGRKNRLEKGYYQQLDIDVPEGEGIFVFHSPIAEMKPADIPEKNVLPMSFLPEGYSYYAGGHIHRPLTDKKDGSYVIYPGTTFGSSYTDLEKESQRGFYIVDDWEPEYVPLEVCDIAKVTVNAQGHTSSEVEDILIKKGEKSQEGDVILLKVHGKLLEGSPEDIDFSRIIRLFEREGDATVFLNRNSLEKVTLDKVKIDERREEEVEKRVMEEYGTPEGISKEFAADLLKALKSDKKEGETTADYENRIWNQASALMEEIKESPPKSLVKEEKKGGKNQPRQITLVDYRGGGK
ncbi:MAG: DNA repair exonuclease [Thermoplasmata archaeon]